MDVKWLQKLGIDLSFPSSLFSSDVAQQNTLSCANLHSDSRISLSFMMSIIAECVLIYCYICESMSASLKTIKQHKIVAGHTFFIYINDNRVHI